MRGVSFELEAGESLGLVGESGCGKSTLGRAVLGLEPMQGGSVRVEGEEVRRRRADAAEPARQDAGGLPGPLRQLQPAPPRRAAGGRALPPPRPPAARGGARRGRWPGRWRRWGSSAADAEKYIHEFSGGQRQRIAIARALIIRPKLIVLDEAVSALDVQVRAQILDLLADLMARHGLAYLFISHDMGVVRAITDRVMVMRAGEIVEEGPTRTVFEAPEHPYTRELMASTPVLKAAG